MSNTVVIIYIAASIVSSILFIIGISCYCYHKRRQNQLYMQNNQRHNIGGSAQNIMISNRNQPAYGQQANVPNLFPSNQGQNPSGYFKTN
jgi:hypothetical protein